MAQKMTALQNTELKTRVPSVEFKSGDLVAIAAAGNVAPATPGAVIYGVCLQDVNSTDANFALSTEIYVDTAEFENTFEFEVGTGVAVKATHENTLVDVDAADASKVNVSAVGTQIFITKVLSKTKVEGKIANRVV
jgi:hypothetical protein